MPTSSPKPKRAAQRKLASCINEFSLHLFREINRREQATNIFLSPFSVFSALAMLYNGADGNTQTAMAKTLNLPDSNHFNLKETFHDLWEDLQTPETLGEKEMEILRRMGMDTKKDNTPTYQLEIANSLWVKKQVELNGGFLEIVRNYFHGQANALDFHSPQTTERINQWVKEKTHGKIPSMITQIDPLTLLLLLNAVYFKGKWKYPFPKEKTQAGDFHLPGGHKKRIPMMHMEQAHELLYFKNDTLETVSLPYGRGRISMYIVLPEKGVPQNSFLKTLTPEKWENLRKKLRSRKGRVVLPRFQLNYSIRLNEALQNLGMGPAFNPLSANFNKLKTPEITQPLHIGEVLHKSFLEVNEEGTEAAGVTSVSVVFASFVKEPEPFTMIVDRPFFCAICDNATGTLLFAGVVVDPEGIRILGY